MKHDMKLIRETKFAQIDYIHITSLLCESADGVVLKNKI